MGHPFRTAVEARDRDAMAALLAADVVFWSPVAFPPFRGSAVVAEVLANVVEVFEDFSYLDELEGPDSHALIFSATVGGKALQGLDYLTVDADGLIEEFTVMIRPMSGVIALAEAMGPRVAHLPKG